MISCCSHKWQEGNYFTLKTSLKKHQQKVTQERGSAAKKVMSLAQKLSAPIFPATYFHSSVSHEVLTKLQ